MAQKLRSLLQSQQSILVLKAFVFAAFLSLMYLSDFSFIPILFFIVSALVLYFKPLFNTLSYLVIFMILITLSIVLAVVLPIAAQPMLVIGFSFLFFIILGLKNLSFVNRIQWYNLLHLLLFYALFLLFFSFDKSNLFVLKSTGILILVGILFRYFLKFNAVKFSRRRAVMSWALALMVIEAIWAISLLPIGFISSANLSLVLVLLLSGITVHHFKGTLDKRVILSNTGLFLVLTILIFITSKWTI